ncbi:MAG TPA: hypothetical protein V6D28_24640 [Leptolyngbyaceae cyanobacterium]
MLKLVQFVKLITTIAIATTTQYATNQLAFAQTAANSDIKINQIRLAETLVADVMNAYMEVPDRNTTVSAFGGRMRLYDVHVARMIALSHHFYCNQPKVGNIEKVMQWEYRANNGRINMGTFNFRCNQVELAVKTYGLGAKVPMKIEMTDGSQKIVDVALLDIQGNEETNRFLNLVQTIKPQR